MLRVAGATDGRLNTSTSTGNSRLAMARDIDDNDDADMPDAPSRTSEENGRAPTTNGRVAAADRADQDFSAMKKSAYSPLVPMLKPKPSSADPDGDTSFGAASTISEVEPSTPTSASYSAANGTAAYSSGLVSRPDSFQPNAHGGDACVFGTFRSSIPQEVFEKIKERITASREREKQSVAKQILRKEEEKRKLAREQDAEDLEATIRTIKENIRVEKSKRQLIYTQLKQKLSAEEGLKKEIAMRDRGREMSNHAIHHSYPNATMLISQTNPSMRPRLMQNYPPINLPMGSIIHQNNAHMDAHTPNMQKRQRSVSPGQIPGPSANSGSVSNRLVDPNMGSGRTHLQPPPHKISRPGAQTTPDTHGGPSQSSRPPVNKSPTKNQISTPAHHGNQPPPTGSNQAAQPVTMAGPFAVASPYGGALGNQVLCLINPGMMGAAPNGQPQFINPAFLQKPEHLAALSPQQQQALMAQQIHAMGQMTPEYFHRALQHLSDTQQRAGSNEAMQANAAMYRQYQAALQGGGLGPQPVLLRPGLQMAQDSGPGGQNRSSHSSSNAQSSGGHSGGGGGGGNQNSDIGSQRVGGITSGQPVFGHALAHPYGMSGGSGGSSSSSRHDANLYPRTGASS